jgi:hypothetical protein
VTLGWHGAKLTHSLDDKNIKMPWGLGAAGCDPEISVLSGFVDPNHVDD